MTEFRVPAVLREDGDDNDGDDNDSDEFELPDALKEYHQ